MHEIIIYLFESGESVDLFFLRSTTLLIADIVLPQSTLIDSTFFDSDTI